VVPAIDKSLYQWETEDSYSDWDEWKPGSATNTRLTASNNRIRQVPDLLTSVADSGRS